jgi:hypothetical protein
MHLLVRKGGLCGDLSGRRVLHVAKPQRCPLTLLETSQKLDDPPYIRILPLNC